MKTEWHINDRVKAKFDEEEYSGSIVKLLKKKAKVLFDDGEVYFLSYSSLTKISGEEDEEEDDFVSHGYQQYDIKWDKNNINFKLIANNGQFYGWWRQTKIAGTLAFAIDIHAKYNNVSCSVESIVYSYEDPRDDINSLNADICCCINKWLYRFNESSLDSLEQLQQKAEKPLLHISKIETLDELILWLKSGRDSAISTGGIRTLILDTDEESDPKVRIELDFSRQAKALSGRLPTLYSSSRLDNTTQDEPKRITAKRSSLKSNSTVDDLKAELVTKPSKSRASKIRRMLRAMGHSGGLRN